MIEKQCKVIEQEKYNLQENVRKMNYMVEDLNNTINIKELIIKQVKEEANEYKGMIQLAKENNMQEKQEFELQLIENNKLINELQEKLDESTKENEYFKLSFNSFKLQSLENENNLNKINVDINEEIKNHILNERVLKKEIFELNDNNQQLKEKLNNIDVKISNISEENSSLRLQIIDIQTENSIYSKKQEIKLTEREETILSLKHQIKALENDINHIKENYETIINEIQAEKVNLEIKIQDCNNEIQQFLTEIKEKDTDIIKYQDSLTSINDMYKVLLESNDNLKHLNVEKTVYTEELENIISAQKNIINKELQIKEKIMKIKEDYENIIKNLNSDKEELKIQGIKMIKTINLLETQNKNEKNEYENYKNTIVNDLIVENSKQNLFYKKLQAL